MLEDQPDDLVRLLLDHPVTRVELHRVDFFAFPTDDAWVRDHGPIFLVRDRDRRRERAIVDFRFDAWGGKYDARLDDAITPALEKAGLFTCPMSHDSLVLEGGAVETDGSGTLLATRGSIICDRRNPCLDQNDIEQRLSDTLGLDRFLWIECDGLHGDDTDGHIDTLARFADASTILHASCSPQHPDHPVLARLKTQLGALRQRDGSPYRLIPLPCPGIHMDSGNRLLPASYANFLVTNSAVLQPVYAQDNDAEVIDIMKQAFPDRQIVPIDSRALIEQNGSIHCATMQTGCPTRPG